VGQRLPEVPTQALTPMQARILAILDERPLTQKDLAARLGLTQQGVNYHVKTLERKGHLVVEREGAEWLCHRVHETATGAEAGAAT
ncbi:MAG TPA: helix-turn-helix domain-containing protein, partial [Candidatus Thermoplasmatota archaeon]|nr:helix-turn-helix domain-containing protein [Candidatus Thermoplasmatota archaeon]